jgi:glutamate racemase
MDGRPIGIFDSGIGGLTLVRGMMRHAAGGSLGDFGGTARGPHRTQTQKGGRAFAVQDTRFLLTQNVKMIVVACHTVSSIALDRLKEVFTVPIVGVVEPGVAAALAATRNGRIGVIGTRATVMSGAYERNFSESGRDVTVFTQACPLFVPLVEEGWLDCEVTSLVAARYLEPLERNGIDTLVLGCTHYPLLKPILQRVMGEGVVMIDSAEETAKSVSAMLSRDGTVSGEKDSGELRFFVSDIPHHFQRVGAQCLGRDLKDVTRVDLESMDLEAPEREKKLA